MSTLRAASRPILRTAVAAGVALAALLFTASAASAHADLVSSTPAQGALLGAEPAELTLHYSEAVTLRLSEVSVIAPDGHQVATGPLHYGPSGQDSLSIALAPDTAEGTYAVDWQATAADDGHGTAGFITFSVGARSTVTTPTRAGAHDELTRVLVDAAIWLGFAGLALMAGDAAVRALCLRGAVRAAPARWTAPLGWLVLLLATLAQLALTGPYARGLPPTRAFDRSLLTAALSTPDGHALMARLISLAVVAMAGTALPNRRAGRWLAAVLTLGLAATWSATSHAASGSLVPLALAVTTVHVAAMAVWVGGLCSLTILLMRTSTVTSHADDVVPATVGAVLAAADGYAPAGDPAAATVPGAASADAPLETPLDLPDVCRRFSRLALTAVLVLAASGLYQAWREVGGLTALTGTPYGRMLIVKVAVLAAVLLVAARSRRLAARRDTARLTRLRTSVAIELLGVAAVLAVTVLLLGNDPARAARAATPAAPARSAAVLINPAVRPPATPPPPLG